MRSSSRPSASATTAKVLSPRSMPTGLASARRGRRSECSGEASTCRLTRQCPPSRVLTVANKIFARPFRSIRRSRRLLSRTRTLPSFGKRTTRAGSCSPMRIAAAVPEPLFRSRKDCRAVFRPLPCVEGIDEIEAGPGHFGGLGALAHLSLRLECVHYQAQALIERKASGAHVPAERLLLLPAGQQR